MTKNYVVVEKCNFIAYTEAVNFTDYRKANAYLHWLWETYYNEEIASESLLDEDYCYHESDYARVQWDDGNYTEFILCEISSEREDFPKDWERYVTE